MKKACKTLVGFLVLLMTFCSSAIAQDGMSLTKHKDIKFNEASEKTEVTLKVDEAYNFMALLIHARLESGSVKVEVFDPKGKAKGNFAIEAESDIETGRNTQISERVDGTLDKKFQNPLNGKWKIVLTPKKAKGLSQISFRLEFDPKANLKEVSALDAYHAKKEAYRKLNEATIELSKK